jgi:hypothetical protein
MKRVVIDMTDEKRILYAKVAHQIVELLHTLPSPPEAHAVLKLVLQSFEINYGIVDSELIDNETDTLQ